MKVIVAPENYESLPDDIKIFLAGGITGCEDWQNTVISELESMTYDIQDIHQRLVILNPRRAEFSINDSNIAIEQINWEFNMLETCDIFSMYFSAKQLQPICLYELGRNLLNMKIRFPTEYLSRICITCPQTYERSQDVAIQTSLALFGDTTSFTLEKYCNINGECTPITHAAMIMNCITYNYIYKENKYHEDKN